MIVMGLLKNETEIEAVDRILRGSVAVTQERVTRVNASLYY